MDEPKLTGDPTAADLARFWTAPSFADGRPRWKTYALGVKFDGDGASNVVQVGMADAQAGAQRELERMMFSAVEPQPYVPPTRRARLRSWLGWKLWRLATWLEPNVCN